MQKYFKYCVIILIVSMVLFMLPNYLQNKEKIKAIEKIKNAIFQTMEENNNLLENWKLQIPKINLDAPIAEGTDKKTMDEYIGHFVETSKTIGNVGLAAHNRGYRVNYFQNIKDLKIGDEVIYIFNNNKTKYEVSKIKIIKDTDWTKLENTKENTITLITCVENKPQYRRCIQCIQKIEQNQIKKQGGRNEKIQKLSNYNNTFDKYFNSIKQRKLCRICNR